MNSFSFTWKIENFLLCVNEERGFVSSPTFMVNSLYKTAWYLELYPYGNNIKNQVACFLRRSKNDISAQTIVTINFSLSLKMADGTEQFLRTFENQGFSREHQVGCQDLIKLDDIVKESKTFLPKKALTIRCYLQRCIVALPGSEFKDVADSIFSFLYDTPVIDLTPEMKVFLDDSLRDVKDKLCPSPDTCTARTIVRIEKLSIVWHIKNFTQLKTRQKLILPAISASMCTPSLFLMFYLDVESATDEHVQIEIIKNANLKTVGNTVCQCEIAVLNKSGKPCDFTRNVFFFDTNKKNQIWMFPPIVKKTKIIDEKSTFLLDDTLSLCCKFVFSDGTTLLQIENTTYSTTGLPDSEETVRSLTNLSDDLCCLGSESNIHDVNLLVGKDRVPAHKAILSARSPVFRAMFESDMAEKERGIVNIADMDMETLTKMLAFMYGEMTLNLDCESAVKLYSAADKYECISLRDQCASFLKKNLKVANVCNVLVLADMHQDEELKTSAQDFIRFHGAETLRSEEWNTLMKTRTQLAGDTLHHIALVLMKA